jgi:hypothetical protein
VLPDGKALLPLKKGGLGHTYAAMLIPAAFYATYTQHAFHDRTACWCRIWTLLGLHSRHPPRKLLLSCWPTRVSCVSRRPPVKLQRSITRALQTRAHAALKDSAPDDRDKRDIAESTDTFFLPFLVLPTNAGLVIDLRDYISSMSFCFLPPQLLRTPRTVTVDTPVAGVCDFSYQANARATVATSSAIAILFMLMPVINPQNQKLRRDMTRSSWCALSWSRRLATAGFWLSQASQIWERGLTRERQGDVFFRYESKLVHIHYLTVVVHPLSTYMDHGERVDDLHALGSLKEKP